MNVEPVCVNVVSAPDMSNLPSLTAVAFVQFVFTLKYTLFAAADFSMAML